MHPIITSWFRIDIFFTNHSYHSSTDLQSESSFVVSIGNSTLFDSSVGWQGSLGETSVSIWKSVVEENYGCLLVYLNASAWNYSLCGYLTDHFDGFVQFRQPRNDGN